MNRKERLYEAYKFYREMGINAQGSLWLSRLIVKNRLPLMYRWGFNHIVWEKMSHES